MFRWPGNREKLVNFLIHNTQLMRVLSEETILVEPLAGSMSFSRKISSSHKIFGNDSHFGVYCFWLSVWKKPEQLLSEYNSLLQRGEPEDIFQEYDRLMTFNIEVINKIFRGKGTSSPEEKTVFLDSAVKAAARFYWIRNNSDYCPAFLNEEEVLSLSRRIVSFTCFDISFFLHNYQSRLFKDGLFFFGLPYHRSFRPKFKIVEEALHRISGEGGKFIYVCPPASIVPSPQGPYFALEAGEEEGGVPDTILTSFPLFPGQNKAIPTSVGVNRYSG